ncbi:MAG: nitric oxide reductase activation protein NorD [Flavobacteriaceae bacterium]
MFEPDEYLFSKFAKYFKARKKKARAAIEHAVRLEEIKPRLIILARAITARPIEIFEAEREGGYKDDNFFLPGRYSSFSDKKQNLSFYLFRVLYLAIQKNLDYNFKTGENHTLDQARTMAFESSGQIVKVLFAQFPLTEHIYKALKRHYVEQASEKKPADYSFIYGKWMKNSPSSDPTKKLKNVSDLAKKAIQNEINTVLKANAVEELNSLQIDKKAQEDYVLTHNFEKVETAEEWEGGWRDFDGDDDLQDHANALEDLNMKHTVRVDDPVHSVYQADFTENTTIAESEEMPTTEFHYCYDEWDFSKRNYKADFCKVYPKEQQGTDIAYYKKTIQDYAPTIVNLRKMLASVNNKYQQQRRQTQGEAFDLDAITDLFVDVHSRHTLSEKIYLSKRKKEKELSILMLLDISLSSDGYAAGNRVIDVEKQVSIIFGEILNEFNVDFSIGCFYSKTRNYTTYITLKAFDDNWNLAKHKVGVVEPCGYTRIGAALRHSGALLDERNSKNRWVIFISDG